MKEEKAKSSISILVNIVSTVVLVFSVIICVLIIMSLKSFRRCTGFWLYGLFRAERLHGACFL